MILLLRWTAVCLFGLFMAVNAVYMLVSPRAWFRLPWWLSTGSLPKKRYSTGWGADQVRMCGGVILATLIWVIFEMVSSR